MFGSVVEGISTLQISSFGLSGQCLGAKEGIHSCVSSGFQSTCLSVPCRWLLFTFHEWSTGNL